MENKLYLKQFTLPLSDKQIYPYGVLGSKQIETIDFEPITIFYGGNGSGKSTLLNVIADTIHLKNKTLGNTRDYYKSYIELCKAQKSRISEDSAFIRSEDIMNKITKDRAEFVKMMRESKKYIGCMHSDEHMMALQKKAMTHPEKITSEEQLLLSNSTEWGFISSSKFQRPVLESNGETALNYFKETFEEGCLYLLDEPENSLSPVFQKELAYNISLLANRAGCQFVIASHSPFILSMHGAKVYDLDSKPTEAKEWYELANMQAYYELFHRFGEKFDRAIKRDQ